MRGLILAAGRGKRLSPITNTRPKPMIPIGGKPILEYMIENLRENGITEIIIVVGYQEQMIKDYFGTGVDFGVQIKYLTQQNPSSVEDAILTAAKELEKEDSFILCHADVLCDTELIDRTLSDHHRLHTDASIAVTLVKHPEFYGVVELDDEARISKIIEKPKPDEAGSHYAIAGIYVLKPDIFELLQKKIGLDQAIQKLIDDEKTISASVWEKDWVSVTYPWDLLFANQFVLRRLFSNKGSFIHESVIVSSLAKIQGTVYISENVVIRPGAHIIGPVYIGANSYIGSNTLIRTNSSIGKNVCVGFGVEVKNSVLLDGCHIGRLSYIGDSIIGQNVQFGAGTQTQNVQPNHLPIQMEILGQKFTLPVEKFGVMLGDKAVLGINISINPGIRIGENCTISPSTYINQDIASNVRVSEQRKLIISPKE